MLTYSGTDDYLRVTIICRYIFGLKHSTVSTNCFEFVHVLGYGMGQYTEIVNTMYLQKLVTSRYWIMCS